MALVKQTLADAISTYNLQQKNVILMCRNLSFLLLFLGGFIIL